MLYFTTLTWNKKYSSSYCQEQNVPILTEQNFLVVTYLFAFDMFTMNNKKPQPNSIA